MPSITPIHTHFSMHPFTHTCIHTMTAEHLPERQSSGNNLADNNIYLSRYHRVDTKQLDVNTVIRDSI